MNTIRLLAAAMVSALVFVPLACGDGEEPDSGSTTEPSQPTASGPLVVSLVTPADDDGAILIEVEGGPIDGAEASTSAYALFSRETGASSVRVAVVGDLEEGELLEIDLPDGSDLSGYEATILEVADRENALRVDLSGYDLTVATP